MASSKSKKKRPKSPVRPHARSKTIVVTVALYGPNDTLATKLVASAVHEPTSEIKELKRCMSDAPQDVRNLDTTVRGVAAFIAKWNPRVVIAPETIIGCPHEEGVDYPAGGVCPQCEFWKGRNRFTGEYVQ